MGERAEEGVKEDERQRLNMDGLCRDGREDAID